MILPSPHESHPYLPMKRRSYSLVAIFPLGAFLLLFLPAVVATICANSFADWLYDPLDRLLSPLLSAVAAFPPLLAALLGGDYGLIAMFPFLILYAFPTIVTFSIVLALYQSTGLVERIAVVLHPFLQPFGLGATDLVRVVMGFGCNVPAIVSTRGCGSCSRGACISAISFGSACSYQLPATLAVFAAVGMSYMGVVYLALLALTTLVYLRFTTPKALRKATALMVPARPAAIRSPTLRPIVEELWENVKQFFMMSVPVFILICITAAVLDWLGVLKRFADLLSPLMALFNLPGEAAMAVVFGAVRKDGIAVGLLDSESGALKVALETPAHVLTAVYLSGVLLPCIVTVFTIIREMRWKFAVQLCLRQVAWASGFSVLIAWGGAFF